MKPGRATLDDLLADVKRGIYIEGHGSYSIDQRRYNFQFGGDAFWLIENGRRTHMVRDVIYTASPRNSGGAATDVADATIVAGMGSSRAAKGSLANQGWMTHAASTPASGAWM